MNVDYGECENREAGDRKENTNFGVEVSITLPPKYEKTPLSHSPSPSEGLEQPT